MGRVNLAEKFALFDDHWNPRLVGTLDDYDIKLVKLKGEFVWHKHDAEDEMFLVVRGRMTIDFRDRSVGLEQGECEVMLLERQGVVNTGGTEDNRLTRHTLDRI